MKIIIGILLFFFYFFAVEGYSSDIYEIIGDQINARTDSTVLSTSLGYLNNGEKCEVIEKKFDWYKIVLPERFNCYVSGEFFKEVDTNIGEVTTAVLNLRDKPSVKSSVIGRVEKGDKFFILKKEGDWFQIRGYPQTYGWVHDKFMKKLEGEIINKSINQDILIQKEEKPMVTASHQSLEQVINQLSEPMMLKKKNLHDLLIEIGPAIIPKLEERLPEADINSKYSIVWILSRLGRKNYELALDFIIKVDSISDLETAGVYLDIIQNIVQPQGDNVPYFYLATKGKLTMEEVKNAKNYLHKMYNKQLNLSQNPANFLKKEDTN